MTSKSPPRHFKFMSKKHMGDFLRGRVRIANLSYYRKMEGPEWIANKEEGFMSAEVRDVNFSTLSPIQRSVVASRINKTRAMKIEGPALETALIDVCLTIVPRPAYVLCFSIEPFESAMRAMCVDAPDGYRYDACVEILDIAAFCQAILDSGTVGGVPLGPEISSSMLDSVKYQNRHIDVWQEAPPDDPTFAKPAKFATQQEPRFAMSPYSDAVINDETIFVDFNGPEGILREIPLSI